MALFDFITWNVDPELVSVAGFSVRWYGLLFAMGFILGQPIITRFFKFSGYNEKLVDTFVIYSVVGTVVGARLGHVLFYGPHFTPDGTGYFDDPISILNLREGGLASHGALIGLLTSCFVFYKYKIKESYLWITDRLVVTIALGAFFIRFGNLMNSEIIGKPTNALTGFVFASDGASSINNYFENTLDDVSFSSTDEIRTEKDQDFIKMNASITFKEAVQDKIKCTTFIQNDIYQYEQWHNKKYSDRSHARFFEVPNDISFTENDGRIVANFTIYGIPRHPSQLYEALSSLCLFFLLFYLVEKSKGKLTDGLTTSIFLIVVFGLRFVYEIFKENQVAMEDGWALNMGQILSIPAVLFGLYLLFAALKKGNKIEA